MDRIRARLRPTTFVEHEHEHGHDGHHRHAHVEPVERPEPSEPVGVVVRHRHRHRHEEIRAPYGVAGAVGIGLVHGIGAETPTQVLALAAGTVSLAPFLLGLFLANTVVAVVAVIGLTERRLRWLNALVGAFSIYVAPFLLATSPPLLG